MAVELTRRRTGLMAASGISGSRSSPAGGAGCRVPGSGHGDERHASRRGRGRRSRPTRTCRTRGTEPTRTWMPRYGRSPERTAATLYPLDRMTGSGLSSIRRHGAGVDYGQSGLGPGTSRAARPIGDR